jgi:hypothetical protein
MPKLNKRQQELLQKMPKEQREKLLNSMGLVEEDLPEKETEVSPGNKQESKVTTKPNALRARSSRMIANNPFNILGLLAGSPEKEIARRKAQVNAYLNVGKELSFEEDIPTAMEGVERTKENVAEAFAAIEQYHTRSLHAFFWFTESGRADGPALAHLRSGDTDKARDIWYRVASLGELTEQSISCASNLGTLALLTGEDNMETLVVGVNWKLMVIDSPFFAGFLERIGDAAVAKDITGFIRAWSAQLCVGVLPVHGGEPAAMQKFASCLDGVAPSIASLVREPFEEHYGKQLERLVGQCASKREADKANAHLAGRKLLTSSKPVADVFKAFAGTKSMAYQHAADEIAEELLECAIWHWNASQDEDTIDIKAVEQLVKHAKSLAQGSMLKARIDDNWTNMEEYIAEAPDRQRAAAIGPVLNELKALLEGADKERDGLDVLERFIQSAQLGLVKLKDSLGEKDELYINVSSAVVGKAQTTLVEIVNKAQKRAEFNSAAKLMLPSTLKKSLELQGLIGVMAMRPEQRDHFNKNLAVLEGLVRQFYPGTTTTQRVTGSAPRTNQPASEPGWIERNAVAIVIFVVIGIFLTVCNN